MKIAPANRLQKLPPYLFAALRQKIAAKRAEGIDVITLGIGDPDYPTPDPIIAELVARVADNDDPDRHRYGCDALVPEWTAAVKDFYQRRYKVTLADNEIVTTMGSKDAIVKLCLAIMDPGDVGIAPLPGYPTYNIGHVFASGVSYYVPLRPENNWLLDFAEIPIEVCQQAKILWINYPNNPTTAIADLDFFKRAVEFGRKHNVLIAHDSAYSENTFDGYKAPSIMEVEGAQEVAVEFFSLSKGFNMTGWRLGCMVGNASVVKNLSLVKDNIDNGSMRSLQYAGAKALNLAEALFPQVNAVYTTRRDIVCDALASAGWQVEKPQATIYVWAPVPEKYQGSSLAFAEDLLEKEGVVVTPGRGYGETGEGYYRISLSYPDDTLSEAMRRIIKVSS